MKIYRYLLAIAACSALVLSCSKNEPEGETDQTETPGTPVTGTPEEMTFTVTPETVSDDDLSFYDNAWKSGDCISVLEGASSNKFEFTSENAFDGSAVASGNYYALYPYDEDAALENGAVKTEIPVEQTGKQADLKLLAIGYSASKTISMKNATGVLKFTLDEDNVTKVTVSGNNGEILAGSVSVSWNGGDPKISAADGGSTTVSVGDGQTVLEKGDYYVNVAPIKAVGYTVTLTYKYDESTYEGYFDTWEAGMTKDAGVKMEYTRGASEFPMEFPEGPINMSRGKLFELTETLNPTLVFYDDYENYETVEVVWDDGEKITGSGTATGKYFDNGVRVTIEGWDNPAPVNNSTENPYSGTSCIKWLFGVKYGEVYFQTWHDGVDYYYERGALDLTPYRNAHFALEFAYKAEQGSKFYVRLMQHIAGFENMRVMADISEYSTGEWEIVQIPLDEMILSDYVWDQKTDTRYTIEIDDNAFDSEGNPFRWDKVLRLIFTPYIGVDDLSMQNKTYCIDDVKIRKVIFSDQTE